VTDLGNVVKETRGVGGICWEVFGSQWGPPVRPDPDAGETESAHD
jgi:hypothetical protein